MTIFDSQAVVALMSGEPGADEVSGLLQDPVGVPMISALSLAEIVDVVVRRFRQRVEEVQEYVSWLIAAGIEVIPVDEDTARLAGNLRSRHWDRDRRRVSMADCVVLATGMRHREPVATADQALIAAARAEGHPVVPLVDSQGRRPA